MCVCDVFNGHKSYFILFLSAWTGFLFARLFHRNRRFCFVLWSKIVRYVWGLISNDGVSTNKDGLVPSSQIYRNFMTLGISSVLQFQWRLGCFFQSVVVLLRKLLWDSSTFIPLFIYRSILKVCSLALHLMHTCAQRVWVR